MVRFYYILIFANALVACKGDLLFTPAKCNEGEVRKGSECVEQSSRKGSECIALKAEDILEGVSFTNCDGATILGTQKKYEACDRTNQEACITDQNFPAYKKSNIAPENIALGKTLLGVNGIQKSIKICRNYANIALSDMGSPIDNIGTFGLLFNVAATPANDRINVSYSNLQEGQAIFFTTTGTLPSPIVAGTTYYAKNIASAYFQLSATPGGATIDITTAGSGNHIVKTGANQVLNDYDTIDDYNAGSTSEPSQNPWNSDGYECNSSNFVRVDSDKSPFKTTNQTVETGDVAFTQIWKDQFTGQYLTNVLSTSSTFASAIKICQTLNQGNAGTGWHVPSQKQVMQLLIDGLTKVNLAGRVAYPNFIIQTSSVAGPISSQNTVTFNVDKSSDASNGSKNVTRSVICVRE